MQLKQLDHVNIRTANLTEIKNWYHRILQLRDGPRPDFGFAGAWLYIGDHPIVHLVEVAEDPQNLQPKIEHFAISATGIAEFLAHLKAHNVPYRLSEVPGFNIVQVNIFDPDGNHIHIDFAADEPGMSAIK